MTRVRSRAFLDWVRSLSCSLCGDNITVQAAHVRGSCGEIAKPESGMGIKSADAFVIPLCSRHHDEQTNRGEKVFWRCQLISFSRVVLLALALFVEFIQSGDAMRGEEIVKAWRESK